MLSDASVYQPIPYARATEDRLCARCSRSGRYGFVLVDRYADGSRVWRCLALEACARRTRSDVKGREL